MPSNKAHNAYTIYSNAKVANGTTKQYIEDLYKALELEIAENDNLKAQLVKAELDIKRLEDGLVVPECMIKKKVR